MSESTPAAEPDPGSASGSTPGSLSASQAVETLKQAHRFDLGIVGAGLVAFLASLMPYYTLSVEGFGATGGSLNAWHGFFGWFGALAALVGAGILVARILGIALPVPVRTTVLALFGVAVLCSLVALFVSPIGDCDDDLLGGGVCDMFDRGHGVGYWLALLASIAGLALAAMRRSAD